jgi:hypothetical protein
MTERFVGLWNEFDRMALLTLRQGRGNEGFVSIVTIPGGAAFRPAVIQTGGI